eukprot:3379426-Pleurochrysis_carterae.AAC.1
MGPQVRAARNHQADILSKGFVPVGVSDSASTTAKDAMAPSPAADGENESVLPPPEHPQIVLVRVCALRFLFWSAACYRGRRGRAARARPTPTRSAAYASHACLA